MRGFCALTEEAVLFVLRLNYCILEVLLCKEGFET